MVPFPITLSDPERRFQGHGVTIDAFNVLCAQLTRDLFAIGKFLLGVIGENKKGSFCTSRGQTDRRRRNVLNVTVRSFVCSSVIKLVNTIFGNRMN